MSFFDSSARLLTKRFENLWVTPTGYPVGQSRCPDLKTIYTITGILCENFSLIGSVVPEKKWDKENVTNQRTNERTNQPTN